MSMPFFWFVIVPVAAVVIAWALDLHRLAGKIRRARIQEQPYDWSLDPLHLIPSGEDGHERGD